MNEELKKELFGAVDESVKKNLEEIVGKQVAERIAEVVKKARLETTLSGKQTLDNEKKLAFVRDVQAIATGEKAAYLMQSDQTGGYLVPSEVHDEIIRIAATTGIIMRDAQKWPMNAETLEIPRYTGAVMDFTYQGEDTEGNESQNDIGQATLQTKYAQMIIRVGNRFLKNANVNVADWFLAMAAEGLAYRIDKEGFMGGTFTGSPFVGLLGSSEVTVQTMASGKTGYDKFDFAEATDAVAAIPTAAVSDGAFYFHRTVWSKLKSKKDSTSGLYEFSQQNNALMSFLKESGIQPVGMIDNYPVFTTDVLPAFSDSGTSKKFGVFANMKLALALGDKGPMEIAKSTDATVGGKSLFRANQTAFRFGHEHALSVALPAAAVVLKTAAS
jgi:HK97 family phage major capsid protein